MDTENSMLKQQEINQNPFVYGVPVRGTDFFNRAETIEKLLEEAVTGKMQKDVWITGERQVGKTSILKYIQWKYEDLARKIKHYGTGEYLNAVFIYLNVEDNKTPEDFYRNLRQSLKSHFDFKIKTLPDPYENLIYALKYLYLQRKNYIVFLVDEFDAFIQHLAAEDPKIATSFLPDWNKLMQEVPDINGGQKIFSCIFAANHTVDDLLSEKEIERRGSGLVVESIELPWFSKEQVIELAQQYLENQPLQFSDRETNFCFKMTRGYPYFVQKMYYIMYKEKSKDPDPKSYLSKVKEEFGKDFKETIKVWGGAKIPKRTLEKLQQLAGDIIKNAGDHSLSLLFKGIEEFIKMQIK